MGGAIASNKQDDPKINSSTGNRTRVWWVRATYPNLLDYRGMLHAYWSNQVKIRCKEKDARLWKASALREGFDYLTITQIFK